MRRAIETPLVVEELGREGFDGLCEEWDQLVAESGHDEPFWRHHFMSIWLDNFAPSERLRLLVAREGGRLVAALPLLEQRGRMYGLAVRRLRAPANVHSCRFDLPADPGRPGALQAIWKHLRATTSFDVLELPDVPADGAARRLLELAEAEGLRSCVWESMRTPWISLQGGYEALQGRLEAHFRQNLRRRRRKLEAKGKVELQRVNGGRGLEALLQEGLELERAGWKGERGTAIADDPVARGFYTELARRSALRGELSLHFLRLDGRPISFQYGLESGKTYYIPKVAFDEEHGDCSPGQLLVEEVLRELCARGFERFDFLGPSMPWKQDWSREQRAHHWLYVFGPGARGSALCDLKSRWIPRVKEVLKWKR
jgi:CelD/BcsL family acetyltransferase involved in cellulose biosynthesis